MRRCPLDACAAVAIVLHLAEMGAGFFEPIVIGEFPKEEAREFVRQLGGSDRWANDAFLAANFEKIYEVGLEGGCGGLHACWALLCSHTCVQHACMHACMHMAAHELHGRAVWLQLT